jgi:hypothetical protein
MPPNDSRYLDESIQRLLQIGRAPGEFAEGAEQNVSESIDFLAKLLKHPINVSGEAAGAALDVARNPSNFANSLGDKVKEGPKGWGYLAAMAMTPGGPGENIGAKVVNIAERRLGKFKPTAKPPDAPPAEVFHPNVIKQYRDWKEAQRANEMAKLHLEKDSTPNHDLISGFVEQEQNRPFDPLPNFGEHIAKTTALMDSVSNRFKSFLAPGRLPHGNAKELKTAVDRFEKSLDEGGYYVKDLEEANVVLKALDESGALTTTDQVIELLNSLHTRNVPITR